VCAEGLVCLVDPILTTHKSYKSNYTTILEINVKKDPVQVVGNGYHVGLSLVLLESGERVC
jgi:uncharacterized protein (UPF0333 family)